MLKGHKKIVILLFDGMGKNIIEKHLKETSFIRRNFSLTIDSTFPPTTAAATTALLSGRYPIETGWVAWDAYFKALDRNVILFKNVDYNTDEEIDNNYVSEAIKYQGIVDLINEKDPENNASLMQKYPICKDGPKTIRDSYKKLNKLLKTSEKCFVYYYFDSPDYEMHANGIDCPLIKCKCKKIDRFVKKISQAHKDTLFITLADHGHVNVTRLDIDRYPVLKRMLRNKVSGEKRSTQFFVKPEYLRAFKEMFLEIYGDKFELLSKKEVYKEGLFGEGTPHPLFDDMMGDYLAISKDKYSLISNSDFYKTTPFKGEHAGGTVEEKLINVSVINK